MKQDNPVVVFDGVTQVVAEPLRFKAKLAIGENAYKSLRMINRTREIWDVLGAAGGGAALAKAAAMGLGAAATPVGWVAIAALASGGACYGLYRWLGNTKGERVIEIPKFLNTPLDTLGLALFDLIAPLALRLAAVDGAIEPAERAALAAHLVDDWGLDAGFVARAIERIEPGVMQGSVDEMAAELSAFLHANPDCNHRAIATDVGQFLRRLLEAGGPLTSAEEAALAASLALLLEEPDGPLAKAWATARSGAGQAVEQLGTSAKDAADWTRARLPTPEQLQAATSMAASQVEQGVQKAAAWAQEKLPSADQVEGAAKRTLDLAKAGIERIKKRSG
ncbi:hypothetical protein NYO99_17370 [Pelomonas sp. UHG3]|uniref:Uncharacterized protein n=1 Tax=Roseateles hydrophilus TaxID=2975054 RepID=A0ACC6CEN4_9BURK|nr:hypothetical protein [Pelomonas sp. UHG3]MCY4746750.1 hypothetical protein [Pelomonas sp. UHG3]